jgi:hypothetical protein
VAFMLAMRPARRRAGARIRSRLLRFASRLPESAMAGVIPSPSSRSPNDQSVASSDDDNIDTNSAPIRRGRRPKFTAKKDLIIAREVSASKAHIASFGTKRERFAAAAERANANPEMRTNVTSKSIQYKYVKLQALYKRDDAAQRKMSGVGGEVGELEELLGTMQEARADLETQKTAERSAAREREEAKERIGKELVLKALRRDSQNDEEGSSGSDFELKQPRKKKSKRATTENDIENDMKGFGECLRDADLARVAVERERLEFDIKRLEQEKIDRDEDRKLRREELAAHQEQEMEKFKLMMDIFKSQRS